MPSVSTQAQEPTCLPRAEKEILRLLPTEKLHESILDGSSIPGCAIQGKRAVIALFTKERALEISKKAAAGLPKVAPDVFESFRGEGFHVPCLRHKEEWEWDTVVVDPETAEPLGFAEYIEGHICSGPAGYNIYDVKGNFLGFLDGQTERLGPKKDHPQRRLCDEEVHVTSWEGAGQWVHHSTVKELGLPPDFANFSSINFRMDMPYEAGRRKGQEMGTRLLSLLASDPGRWLREITLPHGELRPVENKVFDRNAAPLFYLGWENAIRYDADKATGHAERIKVYGDHRGGEFSYDGNHTKPFFLMVSIVDQRGGKLADTIVAPIQRRYAVVDNEGHLIFRDMLLDRAEITAFGERGLEIRTGDGNRIRRVGE